MLQRTFILGDEWIYFKIYTGFKTADSILTHVIYPLSQYFLENKIIDKWFFIRYSDPDLHLRVRFHINDKNNILAVVLNFNEMIRPYLENHLIWKVQADTYNREVERYGTKTIELSELLFKNESEMICKIILMEQVKLDENWRWLLALKIIDTLLTDFKFSLEKKWDICNRMQENYGNEFNITINYRRQFGRKYREEKGRIEKILDKNMKNTEEFAELFLPIIQNSENSESIINEIKNKNTDIPLQNLLSNYIHMMANRLFRTQQRKHELILYDYLFRYYTSKRVQQGEKVVTGLRKNC